MSGEIKNLTCYFSVPKGEDILMVYNGTSSGLNAALWDPHFLLLTIRFMLRELDRRTYMDDQGTGERISTLC